MKILAISHLFPRINNTAYGIYVARQMVAMSKLGADITLLVPRVWAPPLLKKFKRWSNYDHQAKLCKYESLKIISVPYLRVTGNWFNRWAGLSVFLSAREKALKLHKSESFDVIYSTCYFPDGDAAVRLGRLLNIPTCCLAIGSDINLVPAFGKSLYKYFVKVSRSLDLSLSCGQVLAEKIKKVTGKEIQSVYGVVDLNIYAPVNDNSQIRKELGIPSNKFVILFLNSLRRAKGVYEMLRAFANICKTKPNVILKICGYGPEEEALRKLIDKESLTDVVDLVGYIDSQKAHKWMQASDMFVLPTYHEGMPNAVMEAMACGLPVVATSVGGLPEAVGNCEGAILIKPRSVAELQEAMLKVIQSADLRKTMASAGRKRALEKFSVEKNAQFVLDNLTCISRVTRGK
jgi:teichuronic acid biosynthesis glycosyltransferase TuaC